VDSRTTTLWEQKEKAGRKLEKLYGVGQTEAKALNEEYDRLMVTALDAVKALQSFENEKLGMTTEETAS